MKSAYAYFIKRPLPPACKPPGWKRGFKLVGWVEPRETHQTPLTLSTPFTIFTVLK
jgi:hypothetical protein